MFDTVNVPMLPTISDIFHHVKKRLLAQNTPAIGQGDCTDTGCKYRSGEKRCAAGWCIPDALYDVHMEGSTFTDHMRFKAVIAYHKWTDREIYFVRKLQCIHDAVHPSRWLAELEKERVENNIPLSIMC